MVEYINGQLVLNLMLEQMKHSQLELTVAGAKDDMIMIKEAYDFLP